MHARRQADDEQTGFRVTEGRHRLAEIVGVFARSLREKRREPGAQGAVRAEVLQAAFMRLMMASPKPEQDNKVAPGIRRCKSSSTFLRAAMSRLVVARMASRNRARS